MAVSRLLLPKPGIHFNNRGLVKSTRWCSSSSGKTEKSSHLKRSEALKEKRAVAMDSSTKKDMEMHPGVLPKATEIQNKVGGSWSSLKGMFAILKEQMLGNTHLMKKCAGETPDSTVDMRSSEVIRTHNSLHNNEFQLPEVKMNSHSERESAPGSASQVVGENASGDAVETTAEVIRMHKYTDKIKLCRPKGILQSSEAQTNIVNNERKISMGAPSHIMGKKSSEDVVHVTVLKLGKMHKSPDNTINGDAESIIESSDAISQSDQKHVSTTATSHMTGETFSLKMDQSVISDNSELVKPDLGQKQLEEAMSGKKMDFVEDQESDDEPLSCLTYNLLNDVSTTFSKDYANELSSVGDGRHQPDRKMCASVRKANASSKVSGVPTSSNSSQKVTGLKDLFKRGMNDQTGGDMVSKKCEIPLPSECLENSNETIRDYKEERSGLKCLMDCIKKMPRDQSPIKSQENSIYNETDQVSNKGSTKRIQPQANLSNSDANRKQTSLKGHSIGNESIKSYESKEVPDTGIPFLIHAESTLGEVKSKSSPRVPVPTSEEGLKNISHTFSAEEESISNKVSVRFLSKNVEKSDIFTAFKDFGPIVDIQEVSSIKGSKFKDAFIRFETREGLQNALKKTDLKVRSVDAIVEATSLVDMPEKITIPNLIGDPEVPVMLVKHPTRTIKVKQLTHDISSHQVKEALAFCGSNISSFFLGSSSSVAYVEFETEDAKERALAEHSIYVLGKQLMISRVDAPRTTVIRILSVPFKTLSNVRSICNSYGKVNNVVQRCPNVVDVHFKLAEWPNMIYILNSLNGMEVDGSRWITQPAPVFPPEVLRILWTQPDEKIRVLAMLHHILRKLEQPVDVADLRDLLAKHYGKVAH